VTHVHSDVEQVVDYSAANDTQRPRRRRVLDCSEWNTDVEERQVSDCEVQQQDVGWTSTSRPPSHNHHHYEQVPDDADKRDQCEDNGSLQDVV